MISYYSSPLLNHIFLVFSTQNLKHFNETQSMKTGGFQFFFYQFSFLVTEYNHHLQGLLLVKLRICKIKNVLVLNLNTNKPIN